MSKRTHVVQWVEPTFNGAALLVAVTLSTAIARRRAGRT
jgi:ribose transport system permease protein